LVVCVAQPTITQDKKVSYFLDLGVAVAHPCARVLLPVNFLRFCMYRRGPAALVLSCRTRNERTEQHMSWCDHSYVEDLLMTNVQLILPAGRFRVPEDILIYSTSCSCRLLREYWFSAELATESSCEKLLLRRDSNPGLSGESRIS
jgi:hypothetical protein